MILKPQCPVHGSTLHRRVCRQCNAAYMRAYFDYRRRYAPAKEMWDRARKRARRAGITFKIAPDTIVIPPNCPALGIPLKSDGVRSRASPSLDRIRSNEGYVEGNVRVLSDHANRLKGDLDIDGLQIRKAMASGPRAVEYDRLIEYVRREALLAEVRAKAASMDGRARQVWEEVAAFLEKAFIRADWKR